MDACNRDMVGYSVTCGVLSRESDREDSPKLQVDVAVSITSASPSLRGWELGRNVKLDLVDSEFRTSPHRGQSIEMPSGRTCQVADICGLFAPAPWVRGGRCSSARCRMFLVCRCVVQVQFILNFGSGENAGNPNPWLRRRAAPGPGTAEVFGAKNRK